MKRRLSAADLRIWERYFAARNNGTPVRDAARKARLSESSAFRFERGDQGSSGLEAAKILGINAVGGMQVAAPLSEEASKALEDFAYFRLRYMGRKSAPWQEQAAYDILRYLQTTDREYVVMNSPPGSGKSTLFTHDIPCWLIARDRTKRIMIGSRTERQARMYVGRIKKTLERDAPMRADADSLALRIAFDAEATMSEDFGGFKPEGRSDIWAANALTVRQLDGVALDDKENTVSAWGQDSGFLGGRFDIIIWDDLVDRKNTRSADAKENLQEWWGTEAETRLEPGGVLILQGQRIAYNDLYRYALDMTRLDETPKYRHITFPVHHDDFCTENHGPEARPWPEGCLLDPHRLPWRMLETIKRNDPRVYEVQYQQQDGDLVAGLVDPVWITGGVDSDGYPAPGCLDRQRPMGVVPEHLTDGRGFSFVTVDPSPTEWWGIIWWVYDPETENRYIIDIIRRRLNPEQFLTMDLDDGTYSGIMVDLHREAIKQRAPLRYCIFEINAAQRWLLGQPLVQRWMNMTSVYFVPHTTTINKADPKYGVESVGDLFRQGRVRIPFIDPTSRLKADDLIKELTRYPDSDTTDLVMSTWFHKLAVENLYTPHAQSTYQMPRPGYLRHAQRGLATARRGLAGW